MAPSKSSMDTTEDSRVNDEVNTASNTPSDGSSIIPLVPRVAEPRSDRQATIHLPVQAAYDRWAPYYDDDGNILQAIDSYYINKKYLPILCSLAANSFPNLHDARIVDLGSGTGRATVAFSQAWKSKFGSRMDITCLDTSKEMLNIAERRFSSQLMDDGHGFHIKQWDMLNNAWQEALVHGTLASVEEIAPCQPGHVIVSCLVLEHVPMVQYFNTVAALLVPGGYALLTNMHPDMGNMPPTIKETDSTTTTANEPMSDRPTPPIPTGAGFNDPLTGSKVRVEEDYNYTILEVLQAAAGAGLKIEYEVKGQRVKPWMLEGEQPLLGARGRKWLGTKCWYGMIFFKPKHWNLREPLDYDVNFDNYIKEDN